MSRLGSALIVAFFASASLSACGFSLTHEYEDMVCDDTGCFHCDDGVCETYSCNFDHQCPMGRFCTSDNLCLTGEPAFTDAGEYPGSNRWCAEQTDCPVGEICLTEGLCVTSPGGGPATTPDDGTDLSTDPAGTTGDDGVTDPAGSDTTTDPTTDPATDPADGTDVDPTDGTDGTATDPPVNDPTSLPDHPADRCKINADCGFDGVCLDGGCYFQCDAIGACPPGQACDSGQCWPTATPEVECTFNGECGPGLVCIEGGCFETCAESLDCAEHYKRDAGLCLADTSPVIQCAGAGACADGEGCFDGKCLGLCDATTACAGDALCQYGFCHQKIECTVADDCHTEIGCLDGSCQ